MWSIIIVIWLITDGTALQEKNYSQYDEVKEDDFYYLINDSQYMCY